MKAIDAIKLVAAIEDRSAEHYVESRLIRHLVDRCSENMVNAILNELLATAETWRKRASKNAGDRMWYEHHLRNAATMATLVKLSRHAAAEPKEDAA